jgi:hypothetical protein
VAAGPRPGDIEVEEEGHIGEGQPHGRAGGWNESRVTRAGV